MLKELLTCNLCLFDGEGATAGDAGTGENTQSYAAGKETRAKNPLANVVYGKQETPEPQAEEEGQAAAVETTSDTREARRAEFERLISEEYKEEFGERMQKIINSRFKETKNLQKTVDQTTPIMEILAQKYGVSDPEDAEGLLKAIQQDNTFYEDAAAEAGLTVEQYKHMQQMELENRQLKQYREEAERQRQTDMIYSGWLREAEELRNFYPNFDLYKELNKFPDFGRMLSAGVNVKTAYEALHHDEIIMGAMQTTAQRIAKKTADGIASRQTRPPENGLGSQASANVKTDVRKLTKEDRMEIARRAARGEIISF